jgi:hypothetical protein
VGFPWLFKGTPRAVLDSRRVHSSSAGLLTDGAAVKAIVLPLPAGRPREDQTRARSRWAPPRHDHHRLEEALAPAELLVAEIDGNADGDLFGASKASSEKKRNSGSTSYPPMEVWNPKWNKKKFGSAQHCFFNFWVLGSWVNLTKPASLVGTVGIYAWTWA